MPYIHSQYSVSGLWTPDVDSAVGERSVPKRLSLQEAEDMNCGVCCRRSKQLFALKQ